MQKFFGILLFCFICTVSLNANTLELAKASIEAKNYSDSLNILQSLTAQEPKNIEALYYLALSHYLVGNYEKMIQYGVKAYTQDHTLAKEVRQYANNENFGADVKIGLLRKIRLAKQIRNELYLALQSEPDNINAHYALGYYYIYTPYVLSGSVKKSLYHIDQVAQINKQRAYPIYSSYYKKTKKANKFINNLAQWYKDYPDDWLAVVQFARHQQDSKKPNKSYAMLSQWLVENPDDAKAIYQIGRLAATTGEFLVEGESHLIKYLSLALDVDNPEPKWAHYRLAMIYQHMQNKTKAQEHISKALSLDSENKEFLTLKAKL